MRQISVESACSFAHSMDEDLASPEQFVPATSGWLLENQPVLAQLSHSMALRLSGDERTAQVAETVVGYMVRLIYHAEASRGLQRQLECETCPPFACSPLAALEGKHRKHCCKRQTTPPGPERWDT